jgi:hypothetical protein
MNVAFGLKAHSGWAALVVLGMDGRAPQVVDRCRLELVEADAVSWAKQPYHAAEHLETGDARDLVKRGIASARRIAVREVRAAAARARKAGHTVAACGVLVGEPMPGWTVDEILAVHFRMHKAEGVLFRDVLARAAEACDLNLVAIPERGLATAPKGACDAIATLGKSVGPPWGKDQREAALAALLALDAAGGTRRRG